MEITLILGGYYAFKYKENTEWSLIRLLDIHSGVMHQTMYETKYSALPTINDISDAKIFAQHAPISIEDLVNMHDMTLITEQPITDKDLEGYSYYIDAHSPSKEEAEKYLEEVKALSGQHFNLRVTQENGKIEVTLA